MGIYYTLKANILGYEFITGAWNNDREALFNIYVNFRKIGFPVEITKVNHNL